MARRAEVRLDPEDVALLVVALEDMICTAAVAVVLDMPDAVLVTRRAEALIVRLRRSGAAAGACH